MYIANTCVEVIITVNEQMDYAAFRQQYEEQHPASVPKLEYEQADHPVWMIPIVGAMFITSAIFSGVHTVPTAYEAIETLKVAVWVAQAAGLSAFVFVELGILTAAYMLFRKFSLLFLGILIIAVAIAMVANLHSVSKALSINDELTKAVAVLLGSGAPLMATLSGAVFVDVYRAYRAAKMRAERKHKEARIAWDTVINREFSRAQKASKQSVRKVSNGQTPSGYGYSRTSDAKEVVRTHLEANPGDFSLSVRELADKLGVGKSTVADARRDMQSDTTNGHR